MDPRSLEQIGPYRVTRFIDEGAFAWVFEVVDPKFAGRRLALKVLKPEAAAGEEFRRFERESQLLAGMDHPSIVTIFDFGKDPEIDCFYYTMTYVDGPTLRQRLREGPLSVEEGVGLFIDLLDGLSHLHEQGIIHRDIKPANVLIGRDGRGRLSDLGIARVETERSQTRTGMAVGTALYMSPEQARGRPVDARSDLFSVGLTLYETLTCNVVYDHVDEIDSTSGMDVLIYIGRLDQQKDAEFSVVFPPEPEIPEAVKEVIRTACHLRVDQRYENAAAMRDALRQALMAPRHPVQPPVPPINWLWLAGGGGALAAVLVGLAVWFGIVEPARELEAAHAFYERVAELEERSAQLVDASKDIQPPPSDELLAQVQRRGERAAEYLFDGAEDLQAENVDSAVANFGRAERTFADACQLIATSFLAKRADEEQARIAERARLMSEADAAAVAEGPWKALETLIPKLAAPETLPSGCDAVEIHLARLASVPEVEQAALELDEAMQEIWPKLAEDAHQAALTARTLAETETVEAIEYTDAIADGIRFQERAEERQTAGEYRSAREQFRKAAESFATAQAVIPAARARQQTRGLEAEVRRSGQGIGGAVRIISKADALYSERSWEEATATYREAVEQLRGLRAEGEKRKTTLAARALALTAQEGARTSGASTSAPQLYQKAEATLADAGTALDERRYDEAEKGFASAQEEFSAAQRGAIASLAEARTVLNDLDALSSDLLREGSCDALGTQVARDECSAAEAAREKGRTALQTDDAPSALAALAQARGGYERARSAQDLWERTRPRPPELVKRTPQRDRVELNKKETRSFAIEARDPNGDALSYSWSFDGSRLPERGAELAWTATESGTLAVAVDDGPAGGGSLVETWDLVVQNRPPRLTIQPPQRSIALKVGDSTAFSASATDPDGEDTTTEFRMGGRVVSRSGRYTFQATRQGTYVLEVVATDAAGKRTVAKRTIKVIPEQVAAVKPPPRPPVVPAETTGLPASLPGWRGDVVSALRRYEDALESHEIGELERVLIMGSNSPVRSFYQRKFQRGEPHEVALKLKGDINGDGRTATVDFDQTERSSSRTRTYRYRAHMIKRSGGDWQIERRERRR
ncbi:MAG: protein kinase domain-containing protein [Myxococcota bacterium]